jgi:hypothetical protein
MYGIDEVYKVPVEEISCPRCGLRYGHHNTGVDTISQECSKCATKNYGDDVEIVDADYFIEEILGYKKF